MDNWNRGWRKIVEWDKVNQIYKYKGKEIVPLSYNEQVKMPIHLQNEYYWGEINRIDETERMKQSEAQEKQKDNEPTVDEVLERLLNYWNS